MQVQIKHRYTDNVLFACELSPELESSPSSSKLGFAVREAVKASADLTGADLTGADLTGANLTGANLTGANLTDALGADA